MQFPIPSKYVSEIKDIVQEKITIKFRVSISLRKFLQTSQRMI